MAELIDQTFDANSADNNGPAGATPLDTVHDAGAADVTIRQDRPKRKRRAEQTLQERVEKLEWLVDGLMAHHYQRERRMVVEARIVEAKAKLAKLKGAQ